MGGGNTFTPSSERKKGKEKFYVVFEGRKRGVFDNWKECASQVDGFSNNVHRSYNSLDEAERALEAYEHGKAGSYGVASASTIGMGGGNPTFAPSLKRKKGEKRFYVVFEGRKIGVFGKWEECASQVNGFPGNLHCSYNSWDEAVRALWPISLGNQETMMVLPLLEERRRQTA